MLMKCPECDLPVSDKALNCPHCGYPFKELSNKSARRKPNKRKRLPNGFGQISELKKQNLRKPFRAMVTIGKTDEGKPICKLLQPIAYFETYNDAYTALLEYNKNPYSFESNITVEELYENWTKKYFAECGESSKSVTKTVWRYCSSIKNIKVLGLRSRHIRNCIENGSVIVNGIEKSTTPNIKTQMKTMFNKMLDYAVEYELIERNYARSISISKNNQKELEENREHHIPYTEEEIQALWNNIDIPGVDVILIQCYSGWRPKELELLEINDVNIKQLTMTGGVKTESGKRRTVPIHSKIFDLVLKRYNESKELGSKYLFTYTGPQVHNKSTDEIPYTYRRYHTDLKNIIQKLKLNPSHKPHDGRAHFITQAKNNGMDEYAIKRIVGHKIKDVTESVYTTRDIEWLRNEIEKIK